MDESLEEFESLVILLQMWLYRPQSLSLQVTRIPFSKFHSHFHSLFAGKQQSCSCSIDPIISAQRLSGTLASPNGNGGG